jgi:hypothetical protein
MFRATIMTALLVLAVVTPAAATPAEDAYIAARDAAIAKLKAATNAVKAAQALMDRLPVRRN